jgi:hypothetical protein
MGIKSAAMIALALGFAATGLTAAPPLFDNAFAWPESDANAIPDARIADTVRTGREAATAALNRAATARRLSGPAKRLAGLKVAFGLNGKPTTVDDDTVATVNRNGYGTFGTVKFPSGASFTGEVSQGEGRYTPSPESVLTAFTGWVFGVGTANPHPSEGVFEFKTGDSFTGTLSGSQAHGIYMAADGSRRFVGTMIVDSASPRPVAGIVEDRNRRLLAVVRERHD